MCECGRPCAGHPPEDAPAPRRQPCAAGPGRMAGSSPAMTGPQLSTRHQPAKNKPLIANPVDGRSDNRRTQRRCTQMDADAREWTERNRPSVARLQAASSRCRRAGWDRDRRSGRRHLRPSASICVHLRSTFLASLRDRSTPGATFGPPPRNQTPSAFDRLRGEKGLFRRLSGFCGSTGTGLVIFPSSLGRSVSYRSTSS